MSLKGPLPLWCEVHFFFLLPIVDFFLMVKGDGELGLPTTWSGEAAGIKALLPGEATSALT